MEIFISKIKSQGLRCPDLDFEFKNNISLIQMPNGTGKTTFLELIKSALVGRPYTSKEILNLKDPKGTTEEGLFELELTLKDTKKQSMIVIRNHFDFANRYSYYETNKDEFNAIFLGSDVKDGFISAYAPPEEIKPYLLKEIVDLFVLEGSYVRSLVDESGDSAERAIDAFTGINYLKEAKGHTDTYYKKASTGNKINDTKFLKLQKDIKQIENWIPKIKEGLDKKKSDVNKLISKKDKLEAEIQASQLDEEELQRLKNSVIEATNDLNHASDELFRSLQNPLAINNQVRLGLKQFNDTLGKLKLPGDATQSFFTELCDSDECVCGTKMDEKMISHINKNSQAYFNDDWQGSLNKVKRDIINYEELVVENPTQDYLSNYEKAREVYNREYNNYTRYTTVRTGETSKALEKRIEQLNEFTRDITTKQQEIENIEVDNEDLIKDSLAKFNTSNIRSFKNLPELYRLEDKLEEEKASMQGNIKLKQSADFLKKLLDRSEMIARQNINTKIVFEINSKIDDLLIGDESLEVKEINGNLILTKGGASQGQNLALAYSFVMTLLARSEHDFPLIVDHPFEGLQQETRNEISQRLPAVCNQYLGFLINSEKWGSLTNPKDLQDRGFRLTNAKIGYLTAFRKTKSTKNLISETDKNLLHLSSNGVVSYDQEFFDDFKIEGDSK